MRGLKKFYDCAHWLRAAIVLSLAVIPTLFNAAAEERITIPIRPSPRTERRDSTAASLRADVNLVLVPVNVTDPKGRKVAGLRKEDFHLFEDGVERKVSDFFVDAQPVSIGIILDASNSMLNKFAPSRKAITSFLGLTSPEDEFFLITVQDEPELVQPFTRSVDEVDHELASVHTQGWTALFDGMYLGIEQMKHARNSRRALVVLSDGGDNNSRYTQSEMKQLMKETDIPIYSVSVLGRSPVLEKLADESGGQAFHVRELTDLPDLAETLSDVVHGEYVLGFSPATQVRDGKFHTLSVKVAPSADGARLHAAWRHGYYSPVP